MYVGGEFKVVADWEMAERIDPSGDAEEGPENATDALPVLATDGEGLGQDQRGRIRALEEWTLAPLPGAWACCRMRLMFVSRLPATVLIR